MKADAYILFPIKWNKKHTERIWLNSVDTQVIMRLKHFEYTCMVMYILTYRFSLTIGPVKQGNQCIHPLKVKQRIHLNSTWFMYQLIQQWQKNRFWILLLSKKHPKYKRKQQILSLCPNLEEVGGAYYFFGRSTVRSSIRSSSFFFFFFFCHHDIS